MERIVCSLHVREMPATNTRLDLDGAIATVSHDDDGDASDSTKWWHPIDRIIAMNNFIVIVADDRAENTIIINYYPFTATPQQDAVNP